VSLAGVYHFSGVDRRCDKRRKKEGVTWNHGFPYRKEGRDKLAWPGPWKLRRARRLNALGFPYLKYDDQRRGGSFEGESLKMSGAVSADA
jgi:hypothetical protein